MGLKIYRRHDILAIILFFIPLFTSTKTAVPYKDNSWDVLIFTQNWPTSVCTKWREHHGHSCRPFPTDTWTIHGIWPTKFGTHKPNYCDDTKRFNFFEIQSIEKELDHYWTPVENNGERTSFWSHEWEKHGTCACDLPQLSTELLYFSKGLKWMKAFNMYDMLKTGGISPGQSYPIREIWAAVHSVLPKDPYIACFEDEGTSILLEIRICFDKNLELADCGRKSDSNSGIHTNCKMSQLVHYPM